MPLTDEQAEELRVVANGMGFGRAHDAIIAALDENAKLSDALANIADGIIPPEVKAEWMGLSEEAWYERRGDFFQSIAQDALGRKE